MTHPRPFAGYQPVPFGAPPPAAVPPPVGAPPSAAALPPRRRAWVPSWERPASTALRRGLIAALILHVCAGAVLTLRGRHTSAPAGMPGNFHVDVSPEVRAQRAEHVVAPLVQPPAEAATAQAAPVIEKPSTSGEIVPRAVLPPTRHASPKNALLAPGAAPSSHAALSAPASFQLGTGGQGANSEFAYYLTGVRAKIERSWTPPRGAAGKQALTAKVAFTIGRDGQVSSVTLDERSGVAFFDQTCMDAIRRATPFAPLPGGYGYDDMIIHFAFTYAD